MGGVICTIGKDVGKETEIVSNRCGGYTLEDIVSEPDVLERILNYCPIKDVKNLALASNFFNEATKKYLFRFIRVFQKQLKHKQKLRKRLKKFEDIRVLRIHTFAYTIPNTIYDCISKLPNLRELDLSCRFQRCYEAYHFDDPSTEVDDQGVYALCRGLSNLRVLNLSGSRITSTGCSYLTGLPMLKKLILSYCSNVDDKAMFHVGRITTLTSLKVDRIFKITDIGISYLSNLIHLKELNMDYCGVSDIGFVKVCLLPSLTVISIKECKDITILNFVLSED